MFVVVVYIIYYYYYLLLLLFFCRHRAANSIVTGGAWLPRTLGQVDPHNPPDVVDQEQGSFSPVFVSVQWHQPPYDRLCVQYCAVLGTRVNVESPSLLDSESLVIYRINSSFRNCKTSLMTMQKCWLLLGRSTA